MVLRVKLVRKTRLRFKSGQLSRIPARKLNYLPRTVQQLTREAQNSFGKKNYQFRYIDLDDSVEDSEEVLIKQDEDLQLAYDTYRASQQMTLRILVVIAPSKKRPNKGETFRCSMCRQELDATGFRCNSCPAYYLCIVCFRRESHTHAFSQIGNSDQVFFAGIKEQDDFCILTEPFSRGLSFNQQYIAQL